jgi:PAS domain S-box-containing protein
MGIFAITLAIVSGICLGTGTIHLFVGLHRQGSDMKHFVFGLFALAYGGAVLTGLLMYRAADLPQFLTADRLSGLFAGLTYIFLIWFVAIYTEVQPLAFLAALTALFAALVTAHLTRATLVHGEIVGISMITLPWGEEIALLEAAESTWELVFIVAQLVTITFILYACIRQYRRGERQEALLLGTGLLLFVATIVFDIFVETGLIDFVLASDFGFLPLAVVMSLKLSSDVIRTEDELAQHRTKLEVLVEERTAELEQIHRTARALLDAPPDSALLIDPAGIILDINETAAARLGTSEAVARGISVYDLLEPDLAEARRVKVAEAATSGQPVQWEDVRSGRYVDNRLYPIRDESGQVVSIAVYGADVTERRRAEAALQQRIEELAALNLVAQTLATETDLPSALSQVSAMINGLFRARYTHLLLVEKGSGLRLIADFDRESGSIGSTTVATPQRKMPILEQALNAAEAVVLRDVPSLPLDEPVQAFVASRGIQSVLLAPLLSHGTAFGVLALALDEPGRSFTEGDIRLAETLAGDLAAAIENARLAEQAQAAAVSEERGRIARDLHDSVTQTLYSASLIAEALPRVWDRDPAKVKPNLQSLLMLIRGALAEMRTLLYELRPVALEEASLSRLLHQQADILTARTQTPVEVTVEGEVEVPAQVKTALYRIAQEAFNNIVKYAHATQAAATLRNLPTQVMLTIEDNGRGFDPDTIPPERMGLRIMRERAEQVGATLGVVSHLGQGTRIVVSWPVDDRRRSLDDG